SLDPADQTNDSLAQMALSLRQIGEIRISQGRFTEGQDAFRRSMELTRSLYERDPRLDQRLFDLGQSYFWMGFAAHRDGQFEAAREPFRRYLDVSETLVQRDSNRLDWMLELSYAFNNLGTLDQQLGELESARLRFQRSLEIKRQLVNAEPQQLLWQNELADTLAWLADTEAALGELHQAALHQEQRLMLSSRLASEQPSHRQLQRSVGYASLALARLRLSLGQTDGVAELIERSVLLADQRRQSDPANLQWVEDAARARLDRVRYAVFVDRYAEAFRWLDEAEVLAEQLLAIPEPELDWAIRLRSRAHYLRLLVKARSQASSIPSDEIHLLRQRLAQLSDSSPNNRYLDRLRARVWILEGDLAARSCESRRARTAWRSALNLVSSRVRQYPDALAIQAVAQGRLHQTANASRSIERLADMGYAEPWYAQSIEFDRGLENCPVPSGRERSIH
ncbi:MAG: tetratricopeptide repeat protein, partial [Pseudomonadota bacterium]